MNYSIVYKMAEVVLGDISINKGFACNGGNECVFKHMLEIASVVSADENETKKFVDFVKSENANAGKRLTLKSDQIIGLVTSVFPRMEYLKNKFGVSLEECCAFENILVEAEKQKLSKQHKEYMDKNKLHSIAMKYRGCEASAKESSQKLYKNLENKKIFEEFIDEFSQDGDERCSSLLKDMKPADVKLVSNPKDACLIMKANIHDLNYPQVFIG